MQRKWIVITGGVLSGLGKGVVSASIGRLFRGKKIVPIKCDGYLNVDPGTMNPFEHGEVFVQDDGGEVDMDFGHYERFMDIITKHHWNLTSGKVLSKIIDKERKGDYLGSTVQIIPHVTDEIKKQWKQIYDEEECDAAIIEIGGTVGDIENQTYYEAVRQMKLEGERMYIIHLTYVPRLGAVGEQKTKPTQQAVSMMLQKGLQPDMIICRSCEALDEKSRKKVALFCNVKPTSVISNPDIESIYKIPLIFKEQHVDKVISEDLGLDCNGKFDDWSKLVDSILNSEKKVKIAICGKYTALRDAYISINDSLMHAGAHIGVKPIVEFIETTDQEKVKERIKEFDGMIIPGGFGGRGIEGKITAVQQARELKIPFLGLCLGLQMAVIEYARNVCGLKKASTTEIDKDTPDPVIFLLPEQHDIKDKGATMRLGGQETKIKPNTKAEEYYKAKKIRRRFRHRYEVNPEYVKLLEEKGLIFSGSTPDDKIMQIIELPNHPFFMASQFHPEFSSRLEKPEPLFLNFMKAAQKRSNNK